MINLTHATSVSRSEHDLLGHRDVVIADGSLTPEESEELVSPRAARRLGLPVQEIKP